MANPTLQFANIDLSNATIYSTASNQNGFIRITADFTNGSTTVTNVDNNNFPTYFGTSSILPGMLLISSGEVAEPTVITSYNSGTGQIELASAAVASATGQTARIMPPAGMYFIESASFSKVGGGSTNPPNDFRDITGSEDSNYDSGELPWGVIGQLATTSSISNGLAGKYSQYTITKITDRISNTQVNIFITASDTVNAFKEDTGYALTTNQSALLLSEISGSFMTIVGANDLSAGGQGLGLAAYQTVVASTLAVLTSGSGGVSFPYTGSAEITGSLGVTGSVEALINSSENFLIKNATAPTQSLFQIDNDGVAVFRAREGGDGAPSAILGGLYFTTESAFLGVDS